MEIKKYNKFNEEVDYNPDEDWEEQDERDVSDVVEKIRTLSGLLIDEELRTFLLTKATSVHNMENPDDELDAENTTLDLRDLYIKEDKVTVTILDEYSNDYYVTFNV